MLDILFTNGNIYTMKFEGDKVEALGVKDGKIEFVGSAEDAKTLNSKQIVDLRGKTVIPGMSDAHMHMYAYCQNRTFVDLSGAKCFDDMKKMLKAKVDQSAKGTWIKGVNFDQSKWKENKFPTRKDLDEVSEEHPIVIKRCCLHAVVANSLALSEAGIDINYKTDGGGIVEFGDDGLPNGILREQSTKVFDEILPDPLKDEDIREKIIYDVLKDMSSKGLTCIHTYAAKIWQYNEDVELYKKLENAEKLPVRVTVCIDELFEPEILTKEKLENPYRKVQLGAYKIFSDGSMGSRSAALKEPYSDDPENRGFVICSQEELTEKVLTGYKKGLQPAIHAIGDRALDMTITAIEETLRITEAEGMSPVEQEHRLPFRIIHAQMADVDMIKRIKNLPIVLDMQPIFLCTDLHWIEDRIGKNRLPMSFPMETMRKYGIIMTGGSDCPVESFDPIKGIYAAATRQDFDGYPKEGFTPEERLSVYDAVCMFTKNPHFATGQQDVLGTLETGKFADIAVLDTDPFLTDKAQLKDIKVECTYVAGEKTYPFN